MSRIPIRLFAFALCILVVGCGPKEAGSSSAKRVIAVIPKGTTHEFWKSIHAGALRAAADTGVEIAWKGPPREDDRNEQIRVVEDFVSRGVAGIVLAPLDDTALGPVVAEATKAGIPVVVIDSGLKATDYVSFVATDNYKGGVLAAERLAAIMNGSGRAIMLRYEEGSASTQLRENGFSETIKAKYPKITMISDNQYGGATAESAFVAAENLLTAHKDVEGIYCPNESTTFGMLRALDGAGLAGKVKFVGFDSSEKLVAGLKDGKIHGLVLQNPFRMGDLGVRTIVDFLAKKDVPKRIDTGVMVATKENMDAAETQALLKPALPPEVR